MPRKVVPMITGETYHVYNRGVDRRNIFESEDDIKRFYYSLLYFNTQEISINFRLAKSRYSSVEGQLVKVVAYCLLPNHFHLILKQVDDGGVAQFMKKVSSGYTGYFNEKYSRSGSLFQGVYKRVLVESSEQYNYLLSYVNENHAVHGLKRRSGFLYSSSCHYDGSCHSKLIGVAKTGYSVTEAETLAISIFKKRQQAKYLLE